MPGADPVISMVTTISAGSKPRDLPISLLFFESVEPHDQRKITTSPRPSSLPLKSITSS